MKTVIKHVSRLSSHDADAISAALVISQVSLFVLSVVALNLGAIQDFITKYFT